MVGFTFANVVTCVPADGIFPEGHWRELLCGVFSMSLVHSQWVLLYMALGVTLG